MLWFTALLGCGVTMVTDAGPPVVEARPLIGFTVVETRSVDVDITLGAEFAVQVHGGQTQVDRVVTRVVGDTLYVERPSGVVSFVGGPRVHVVLPDLRGITSTGSADVEVHDLTGHDLRIELSGAGDATLHGSVERLESHLSSLGDLEATGLQGTRIDLRSTGTGDATLGGVVQGVDVTTTSLGKVHIDGIAGAEVVRAVAEGGGDIHLSGEADRAFLTTRGQGDIHARALTVADATVRSTSSGKVELTATGEVTGALESLGDLDLWGGAVHQVAIAGTGEVRLH
jgi:hypothetical protein